MKGSFAGTSRQEIGTTNEVQVGRCSRHLERNVWKNGGHELWQQEALNNEIIIYIYTCMYIRMFFFRVLRFNSSNITLFQSHGQATNISPMFDQLFGLRISSAPSKSLSHAKKSRPISPGQPPARSAPPPSVGLGVGWTRIHE